MKKLEDYLKYEQPNKYIVANDEYSDEYDVPVLTAGKSFVLGYTNDKDNIFPKEQLPVIIFDDFTTDCKYVDFPFKVKSSAMKILHPINNANAKFLYYYMTQIKFDNTLHKRYWISEYSQLLIKELSDVEQNDFVKKMSRIEVLINIRSEQIKNCNKLIKSQFVEMFGDPNFNEKKWITGTVNDIGLCVAGATPSTAIKEYWENGTIPWLSSGEVNKGRIYETDTKISQKGYDNASTKLVPPKTVLIAMAGQGKTRGLSAIAEIELCTNQSVCSIVNNDKVNPEYLLYFFKMQYLELRNASTSSEGRGGLNLKIIGNYKVMIPPVELQNKFANIAEQIDKQKFEFEKSLKKLEELQASLMQEYFG